MKKIIFGLFAVVLLFASCADKNAYAIRGTINRGEENLKAYLTNDFGETYVDSALVKDGRFTFSGIVEESEGVVLVVFDQQKEFVCDPILVILEPGNITVTIKGNEGEVSGTVLNDVNSALNKKYLSLDSEDERMSLLKVSFKENANNALGEYLFLQIYPSFQPNEALEALATLPIHRQNTERVRAVKASIEASASFVPSVGRVYKDIKGFTIDGEEAALSDYAGKGKVVLLDFWASWCGPCIQELPNMKKAYDIYKDKGFEIVGVSLDEEYGAWKKASIHHGIQWPQFSNLKGWDEPAGDAYGVQAIPHTVLIDRDGTIIEENLRGDILLKKLEELLD